MTFPRAEWVKPAPPGFTDETEVLTFTGWKSFPHLAVGEVVATRSDEGELEWQALTDYSHCQWTGQLVGVKNHFIDALVSPTTPMVVREHRGEKYQHRPAIDLIDYPTVGLRNKIPFSAYWEGVSPEQFRLNDGIPLLVEETTMEMRTWLRFLALYLVRGELEGDTILLDVPMTGHIKNEAYTEAKRVVEAIGTPQRRVREISNRNYSIQFRVVDPVIAEYLRLNTVDVFPPMLKELSPFLLNTFFRVFSKMCTRRETMYKNLLYLGEGRLAGDKVPDMLMELLLKAGRSLCLYGTDEWAENFSPESLLEGVYRESYYGPLYYVAVPNKTLYIRRNWKPMWWGCD